LFTELRPVGNRIIFSPSKLEPELFQPFSFIGFDSGTSALAAALVAIVKFRSEIINPEVLIPAYSCPDIISACIYAKIKPVLVDFEPFSPYIELETLLSKISDNTIAVIAINFMGIPERISAIRSCIKMNNITLIEDSAQGFPIKKIDKYWSGDLIITSFGRGKPMNLMGGGALFFNKKTLNSGLLLEVEKLESKPLKKSPIAPLLYRIKAMLFNLLSKPTLYFFIRRLPLLNLGATVYHPLLEISPLPETISKQIMRNYLINYKNFIHFKKLRKQYDRLFSQLDQSITSLPIKTKLPQNFPLLRYPILISNKKLKQTVFRKLNEANLGASLMYQTILPEVEKIENSMFKTIEDYPNARVLAESLITLPMHQDIQVKNIKQIEAIILKSSSI